MQATLCSKGHCCQSSAGHPRLMAATEEELWPPLLHSDSEKGCWLFFTSPPSFRCLRCFPPPSFPGARDFGERFFHGDDKRGRPAVTTLGSGAAVRAEECGRGVSICWGAIRWAHSCPPPADLLPSCPPHPVSVSGYLRPAYCLAERRGGEKRVFFLSTCNAQPQRFSSQPGCPESPHWMPWAWCWSEEQGSSLTPLSSPWRGHLEAP